MNAPIRRLLAVVLLLFALLVAFTSNWSVFDASELEAKTENKRPLFEAQQVKRGRITTADGQVIANSKKTGENESYQYVRRYPLGSLFGNPIGYSFITQGTSGFERAENATLTGEENEFVSILDQIRGQRRQGSDIATTLDASAQQLATDQLQATGRPGAVVAIVPSTGAVRVMASTPGFDPNQIPSDLDQFNEADPSVLTNRAIQSLYPPGSPFKVVTAAAALDSGAATPDTTYDGSSPQDFSGVPLSNAGGEQFGVIDMRTALTNSVNTYFAQLGEAIGSGTLEEYMTKFGFNAKPQLDLPDGQMSVSGVFEDGELVTEDDPIDVGRLAIGQERLLATPIQMAEVAATIANDGKLMRPQIWAEVRDPDGRTIREMDPETQSNVISEETANQLTEAMRDVVNEGTGTAAALSGIDVAGKTGTAEIPDVERCGGLPNQAWFVGFAPADDPQVAVAATVECTDGQGGTVAAPIAAAVMQAILDG